MDFSHRQRVEVWSDLRVHHSFWHTPANIVVCPVCLSLFRKSEAQPVGVLPSSIDELDFKVEDTWRLLPRFGKARELAQLERYLATPLICPLDEQQVSTALATAAAEDEIDLRLQQWRHHNDTRRRHQGVSWQQVEALFHVNVQRLLSLLTLNDELHNLLAAEIHRELGQFHTAMQRLALVRASYGHEKVAIMGWIVEGRSELLLMHS